MANKQNKLSLCFWLRVIDPAFVPALRPKGLMIWKTGNFLTYVRGNFMKDIQYNKTNVT